MIRRLLRGGLAGLFLAAAGAALAQDPEKVAIGVIPTTGSGPIFIAEARGYFAAEGLDATVRIFNSAHEVIVATASGDMTFGLAGLGADFYNLAGGGALKIIGAQSRDEAGYPNLALVTPPADQATVHSGPEIRGKRIGITTQGSGSHYGLVRLMDKYGIGQNELTVVPLQTMPNVMAAVSGRQVDAAIATPNAAQQLAAAGNARILLWVGDETPWQLGAVWTGGDIVKSRRETVERFVRAYQRATADYHAAFNRRDDAGKPVKGPGYDELIALIAARTGQPAAVIETGIPYVDARGRIDTDDLRKQLETWQALGLARPEIRFEDIIDTSFIPEPYPGIEN